MYLYPYYIVVRRENAEAVYSLVDECRMNLDLKRSLTIIVNNYPAINYKLIDVREVNFITDP